MAEHELNVDEPSDLLDSVEVHSTQRSSGSPVEIVFEDEHLIAVAKPAGLFVHRSKADRAVANTLLQQMRDQIGQHLFTVHRLDRATSGLVLLAKSSIVAAALGQQFESRTIRKTYQAVVRGFTDESGTIDTPLVSARGRGKPAEHPYAVPQPALTSYTTTRHYELPLPDRSFSTTRISLVQVLPRTGRFHQIRRHFNYISHPVVGDSSHGDSRLNRRIAEFCDQPRLMLAATELQLQHPVHNTKLHLTCPPESSFAAVIERLQPFCCTTPTTAAPSAAKTQA